MRADMELSLIHDGHRWVAHNTVVTARGHTLDELDANLREAIARSGTFEEGSEVTVFMRLTMDQIPLWMRQYNPSLDYFNRRVKIKV